MLISSSKNTSLAKFSIIRIIAATNALTTTNESRHVSRGGRPDDWDRRARRERKLQTLCVIPLTH